MSGEQHIEEWSPRGEAYASILRAELLEKFRGLTEAKRHKRARLEQKVAA